jgi:thioredoxin reductase (NADPH)
VARPCLLLAGSDRSLIGALSRDLAARFGGQYDVEVPASDELAINTLERLAGVATIVPLVIAAPVVDESHGVDFLGRARELIPDARRVLLVPRGEWRSNHPAVRAMLLGLIDAYVFIPWHPIERWLYLPITEFLAAWSTKQATSAEAVQIVGTTWEARAHRVRDVLARGGLPYGFYDAATPEGQRVLESAGRREARLPVVRFTFSGQILEDPSTAEVYEALGFPTSTSRESCDVAVVGAGPAGLTAAVYAASEGLDTLIIEPEVPGGQAGTSSLIRNYLGFPRGISGEDLTNRAVEQAWFFGADFVLAQQVTGLRAEGQERVLSMSDGKEVRARAVVLASGVHWRKLDIPELDRLLGAGVFYGAGMGEARALAGEVVYVVGAGNSAGQAAIHLAEHAKFVTLLVRGGSLSASMSDYLIQRIRSTANIGIRLHSQVTAVHGSSRLEALTLEDSQAGATHTEDAAALFILIGAVPHTEWLRDAVQRDEQGYLITGHDLLVDGQPPARWPLQRPPLLQETSLPGVFAAGDVRYRAVKRVASAVGGGAVAIQLVHEYLAELSG